MKKTITCRHCKEQNNWEIEVCVCAGKKLATECGCGLTVCDHTETK